MPINIIKGNHLYIKEKIYYDQIRDESINSD
jgi:hypothetical protein